MRLARKTVVGAVLASGAVMGAGAYYNFQKYGDIWGPQRFPGAEPEHVLLPDQAGEMSGEPWRRRRRGLMRA